MVILFERLLSMSQVGLLLGLMDHYRVQTQNCQPSYYFRYLQMYMYGRIQKKNKIIEVHLMINPQLFACYLNYRVYNGQFCISNISKKIFLIYLLPFFQYQLVKIRYNKMSSFLQSLNIFPYKDMWRVRNQTVVGHKSVGIASLVAFLLLLVIAAIKIVQVFQMNTISVTTQTDISLVPPTNTLSTFQNSTQTQPFMYAFMISKSNDTNSTIRDIYITAQYVVIQRAKDGTRNYTKQNITLQKCTTQHFSKVPNIDQIYNAQQMDTWTCLPLNQKYELSGSQHIGRLFKYITVSVNCNSTNCTNSQNQNLIIETYTLNSFINPYNSTFLTSPYFINKGAVFQSSTQAQYYVNLDQNIVNTDKSLLPFKSIQKQTSIEASETVQAFVIANGSPFTQIFLQSSGKTYTYKRTYLKLLDAIAYIGGIFPVILAAFFFMEGFGKLVYQMKLASYYFKEPSAQKFGFFSFIKQSVYNILTGLNFKLHWRVQQKREKIKEVVNNMLDIVYLQRRIDFLQRAISIVLQRHQLKGLHLSFKPKLQVCEERYKQFQFRNKFLSYMAQQLQHPQKVQSQRQNNRTQKLLNINLTARRDLVSESIQNIHNNILHKQVPQEDHKQRKEGEKQYKPIQNKEVQLVTNTQQKPELQEDRQSFQKGDYSIDEVTLDLTKLIRQASALYGNKTSKKIVEHLDSQTKSKLTQFLAKEKKKGLYFASSLVS